MHKLLVSIIMATGLLIGAYGGIRQADTVGQGKYCYYLAGVTLLDKDSKDNAVVKAQKYKKLCQLTGVTAVSIRGFIDRYTNKPDQWQKVQAVIADILDTLK